MRVGKASVTKGLDDIVSDQDTNMEGSETKRVGPPTDRSVLVAVEGRLAIPSSAGFGEAKVDDSGKRRHQTRHS